MDAERAKTLRNELTTYAARYWAGEQEVARTFFENASKPEDHLPWLRLQAYKELQPRTDGIIIKLIEKLAAGYPSLEKGEDRSDFLYTIQFLEEEFRHYVVFADAIEAITGEHLTIEELATFEMPQENKLRLTRRGFAEKYGDLARFASSFCEGGGAAIYYEGMQVSGTPLRDQIAAACKSVYDDEVDHAQHGADELQGQAQTEEEWALAREMVEAISKQRLIMRNEQFGKPLSDERVAEIEAGNIELPDRLQVMLV